MNSVSGESHTPDHVMQTSLGRPSPSRVEIAVRVAGLVLAGLTSIPMIADAASINAPCQLAQLGIANGISSTVNLTDCTISHNFANLPGSSGGGIASQGTAILNKCTVTGNTATVGGGIANAGHLFLTDSPVTGNHAIAANIISCQFTGLGGGIFNAPVQDSTVTLIHSPITGNEAIAAKSSSGCSSNGISNTGLGGGILNAAFGGVFGTTRLTDNDVIGNSAASGGGIANAGHMTLTLSNVSGNNSTGSGGGIFNVTDRGTNIPIAALTLTYSDITDNQAGGGGGIFNENGNKVTLNESTVIGNTPDDF